jgi:hypothetical protein
MRGEEGLDALVASQLFAETLHVLREAILGLAKGGKKGR